MTDIRKAAIDPMSLEPRIGTGYPDEFAGIAATREKRAMGDAFGLKNFGVNVTHLPPGAASSQRHWHEVQDELIYILEGEATLITDAGEQVLGPGMAAGFPAGERNGHHLVNKSDGVVVYIEIGDRVAGDQCHYPDIDLFLENSKTHGQRFVHKDGRPYPQESEE